MSVTARPWFVLLALCAALSHACSDPSDNTGVSTVADVTSEDAGPCEPGRTRCGPYCVSILTDPLNCGRCDNACAEGIECVQGACVDFGCSPTSVCEGECRDLRSDQAHCGACGVACEGTQVCQGGVCGCATGTISCGNECIDPTADERHCGGCGTSCGYDERCCAGNCAPILDSAFACGACDATCDQGQQCKGASCCATRESCDGPQGRDEDCDGTVNEGCPDAVSIGDSIDGLACRPGSAVTCTPKAGEIQCAPHMPRAEGLAMEAFSTCLPQEVVVGVRAVGTDSNPKFVTAGLELICGKLALVTPDPLPPGKDAELKLAAGPSRSDSLPTIGVPLASAVAAVSGRPTAQPMQEVRCPPGAVVVGLSLACEEAIHGFDVLCAEASVRYDAALGEASITLGKPQLVNEEIVGSLLGARTYYGCAGATGMLGMNWSYGLDSRASPTKITCAALVAHVSEGAVSIAPTQNAVRANSPVSATAPESGTHPATLAVDGDHATYYESQDSAAPFFELDLGQVHLVRRVEIFARALRAYKLSFFDQLPTRPNRTPVLELVPEPADPSRLLSGLDVRARFVRIDGPKGTFLINELAVDAIPSAGLYAPAVHNLATDGSDVLPTAAFGVDGSREAPFVVTPLSEDPYYRVELGSTHTIEAVHVWNRSDDLATHLQNLLVLVLDDQGAAVAVRRLPEEAPVPEGVVYFPSGVAGSAVELRFADPMSGRLRSLSFAELEIIGAPL